MNVMVSCQQAIFSTVEAYIKMVGNGSSRMTRNTFIEAAVPILATIYDVEERDARSSLEIEFGRRLSMSMTAYFSKKHENS